VENLEDLATVRSATGRAGLFGRTALWLVSVLATAVTAVALERGAAAVRPRLRAFARPLLDRAGAGTAHPRLTDRQRLEVQLRTWRQAHPGYAGAGARAARTARTAGGRV
jgi:hypothetical protein